MEVAVIGRPNVKKLTARRDVPGLMEALHHRDPTTRRDAAVALGSLGDTGVWSGLTPTWALATVLGGNDGAAAGEQDPDVRLAAIEALGSLVTVDPVGAAGVVSPLFSQASQEYWLKESGKGGNDQILSAALAVIASIGTLRPHLIDGLIDGQLRAFGWYGSSEHRTPAMVALGGFGVRWLLTSTAESSVLRFERPRLLALFGEVAVDECRLALTHPEPLVRIRAVHALAFMTDDVSCLTTVARSDHDPSVREQALAALGEMGRPDAYDALAQSLTTADPDARVAIIKALTRTGDRRSVDALVALTSDEDPKVRWSAAGGLAHLLEAHRAYAFSPRLRDVLRDDDIDRVIGAIAQGAPDATAVEALGIKPRSLGKRAVELARRLRD